MGQPVWVKSLPTGTSWLPGTIIQAQSLERFRVCLRDGRTVDRHVDHIRPRIESAPPEPHMEPVIPASELLEDNDPPLEDGAPPPPSPGGPLVDSVEPSPPSRRSVRDRRPPEMLM